jgi:hypothetical protein
MNKYIIISDKVKVKNPCYLCENNYMGKIEDFNFKDKNRNINQENNYLLLQDTLNSFNLKLLFVWAGTDNENNLTKFVVTTENNEIVWYKYEGKTPGGGQNYLYIYGKKIKLTKWLGMSIEERDHMINV